MTGSPFDIKRSVVQTKLDTDRSTNMNAMVLSGLPLPLELVSMIFSLLSRYDLIACSTVAQSWRYHAQNGIFREYSIEIDHKCEREWFQAML